MPAVDPNGPATDVGGDMGNGTGGGATWQPANTPPVPYTPPATPEQPAAGQPATTIAGIINTIAAELAVQYGVDASRLAQISLGTMQTESGGDPQAVGDQGTSFGLFQLHQGGELGSLTEQQAFDPATNARVAMAVIAQVLRGNPGADDGTIAAMAQRPADRAGYAAAVNGVISGGTGGIGTGSAAGAGAGTVAYGTGGSQAAAGPPPLSDIAALDTYVRQNFGTDAWLLDVPSVRAILEAAVAAGDNAGQIQAVIQQTDWWKTTSQNMQSFEALQANTPAELNFNTPGSQAARQLTDVMNAAAKAGVTISPANAQQFALDMMKYGWDANQLNAAIGATVYYTGSGATAKTDAGALISQLQAQASQYLLGPNDPTLQSYAQNIASGTQTIEQFDAWLKQQASLKWTGMAGQIQQGYTPNQIVNNLRQSAAQTMEVDPSSINFVTDPTYSKILDYVPPNSPNGVHRIMTQSEMDQYLKATPQWATTQQSRDQVGNLAQTMLTTLGKVG